jgi:hypothetical protein
MPRQGEMSYRGCPSGEPRSIATAEAGELGLGEPSGPTGRAVTAQGHPRTIFKRAIERGDVVIAETTAGEIGGGQLEEAFRV